MGDGSMEGGMLESGGDFGEGGEDEAAFVQGGVGKGEIGCLHDEIAVEQEVEVDDARAFGWGGGAVSTHGVLDGEEVVEEVEWGESCVEEGGGVEEAGLVEVANGVGGVEGGYGGDVTEGGEAAEGFAEVGVGWAEERGKI
jgi:hypothetical protein